MHNNERAYMIERYLNGQLTPAEQQELARRLETDADLRRLLDVERAMVRGMHRDRDAIPKNHGETRAKALSMLATVRPVEPTSVEPGAGAASGGSKIGGAAGGSTTIKMLVTTLAAGIVAVGAFVVYPLLQEKQQRRAPMDAPSAAPSVQQPAIEAPVPQPATSAPTPNAVPDASTVDPVAPRPTTENAAPITTTREVERQQPAAQNAAPARERERVTTTVETQEPEQPRETRSPVIFAPDTVKVKVHIDPQN